MDNFDRSIKITNISYNDIGNANIEFSIDPKLCEYKSEYEIRDMIIREIDKVLKELEG